jgi:hypothetical protein
MNNDAGDEVAMMFFFLFFLFFLFFFFRERVTGGVEFVQTSGHCGGNCSSLGISTYQRGIYISNQHDTIYINFPSHTMHILTRLLCPCLNIGPACHTQRCEAQQRLIRRVYDGKSSRFWHLQSFQPDGDSHLYRPSWNRRVLRPTVLLEPSTDHGQRRLRLRCCTIRACDWAEGY